jgi:hypothetical protein
VSKTKIGLTEQSPPQKGPLLGRVINQLKITSLLWKGRRNKGFDPFTISWDDEEKALQEFCIFIKNVLYPVLGPLFKVGTLASYKEEAILDVLIYMAIHGVTSEKGARACKVKYKKGPSPRPYGTDWGKWSFQKLYLPFQKQIIKCYHSLRKKRNSKTPFSLLLTRHTTPVMERGENKRVA